MIAIFVSTKKKMAVKAAVYAHPKANVFGEDGAGFMTAPQGKTYLIADYAKNFRVKN